MPSYALLLSIVVLSLACQRGEEAEKSKQTPAAKQQRVDPPAARAGGAYSRDVDRICNSEEQSGALELEEAARTFHVAQWLGSNIETQEGREFLAKLSAEKPKGKVALLKAESSRLGLAKCDLIKTWSGGEKTTL